MRIPYDLVRDGLAAINQAQSRMADAQRLVSTGKRIGRAGDDPLGAQQAVGEHATLGATDAYSRSRESAASRLSAADAVFSSIGDKLSAAIVSAMSAQGTSAAPAARSAAADAITGLRDSLLADFNTTFNGVAVFAGTAASASAYSQVGGIWTYQGNADTMQVEVDRGRLVRTTFDGRAIAQGADASNVFAVLDALAASVVAGDETAIRSGIQGLERALDRTLRAHGRLGADERGVEEAALRLSTIRRATEARRSGLEDADMAEAITRLSASETSYKAALAAVSTVERQTLLDYLR